MLISDIIPNFARKAINMVWQRKQRLATGSGIYEQMDDNQRDFLDTITNYNIEARYPEDKNALTHTLTPQVCRQIIVETKQLQQWIKDRL